MVKFDYTLFPPHCFRFTVVGITLSCAQFLLAEAQYRLGWLQVG
jgi:hypothetical protein